MGLRISIFHSGLGGERTNERFYVAVCDFLVLTKKAGAAYNKKAIFIHNNIAAAAAAAAAEMMMMMMHLTAHNSRQKKLQSFMTI